MDIDIDRILRSWTGASWKLLVVAGSETGVTSAAEDLIADLGKALIGYPGG